jgi:hypothetical protein
MRSAALVVLALLSSSGALAAQSGIRLTQVPARIVLPAGAGENLLLEVAVTGAPGAVWLARSAAASDRVPLAAAGEGAYQVNLADPRVLALLPVDLAAGAFVVCAEVGAEIVVSAGIGWARTDPPAGTVQCLVVAGDGELRRADGRWPGWFDPAAAERIEVHGVGVTQAQVQLQIGADAVGLPWQAARRLFVLAIDDGVRARLWAVAEFSVEVRAGAETTLFGFRTVPRRLWPTAEASVTVAQRHRAIVPGSRGWLQVAVGDVTGGQVTMSITDALGGVVAPSRFVAAQEAVEFAFGGERLALVLERMVNRLIGDDHVVLRLCPRADFRPDPILQLIRRVEQEQVVFVREGRDYGGPAAAALMRARLLGREGASSPAEFVVDCSRSSSTGEPYRVRLPDGREMAAEQWLAGLLAEIERAAGAEPKRSGAPAGK